MTPEEMIGRVQALEWLLTTLIADGIARSPIPADSASQFQALTVQQCGSLIALARDRGDTAEGRQTAAFASAVVDLGAVVIQAAAAATADQSGPRN